MSETRDDLIDTIRTELKRQKDRIAPKLSLVVTDTPDLFLVNGIVDIHMLADAILREWQ